MFRIYHLITIIVSMISLIACSDESSNDTSAVPKEGLLAFLNFDGNANDLSGKNNHGTLMGGAVASGNLVTGNNAADALSLPNIVMDGLVDFSFAAWVKINTFRNESHELISGANATEDNVLIIWYNETENKWFMGINDGSSAFTSDTRVEDGNWHHIAITRSGDAARLYLDGSVVSFVSVGTDQLDIDAGGLIFGQDQDALGGSFHVNDSWAGEMDNIRIYNRSLSDKEVGAIADEER
jgi:MSHA biogenesis protein MshQ